MNKLELTQDQLDQLNNIITSLSEFALSLSTEDYMVYIDLTADSNNDGEVTVNYASNATLEFGEVYSTWFSKEKSLKDNYENNTI